jgi:acyl-CoA reductase-like NAD-dependent aldehyde dehydrogenase
MDALVPAIAKGGFYHAGQVCVSVQKVFAHESVARSFAQQLATEASRMVVGDPLDPQTDIGPMIAESEVIRVGEWVQEAVAAGAKKIQNSKFKIQNFLSSYSPTVLFSPPEHVKVSKEEVFGPVICVYPYSDLRDAISRANSLRYAFQASVFTRDIDLALGTAQKLNASAVMINDHTAFRVDWMPFGGRNESGIGTGGIPYSMKEMTREKLIVLRVKG